MNISARHNREIEEKVNTKLNENITLLTHIYPPTKEFNEVFKKNMFQKNNKAGFQHVIHYLFTIFDPNLTKEKLTWPLYESKQDSAFRNEVIAFINHINSEYENANVPTFMASQLVSPGGLRIAKFIWKLSMFVIEQHLKKGGNAGKMLPPLKPHKDPNVIEMSVKNLNFQTGVIEREIEEKRKNCDDFFKQSTQEAEDIIVEQNKTDEDLAKAVKILQECSSKIKDFKSVDCLKSDFEKLSHQMILLEKITKFCDDGLECLNYLSSHEAVLEFQKDDLLPENMRHLFKSDSQELDLIQFIHSSSVLLENESLDLPVFAKDNLNKLIKFFGDLKEKLVNLDQKLCLNKNELVELAENSENVDLGEKQNSR